MRNRKTVLLIISLMVLLLSSLEVLAQTKGIYIQPGGSLFATGVSTIAITNGDLVNNGTFTASEGNTVVMNGNASQTIGGTSETTFGNLTVNNTVSVILNGQPSSVRAILLCNGPLITNDKLILLSTVEGTALIDGSGTGTVSGDVTMQRYLPSAFGYKYFSSPFVSATVNEFGDEVDLGAAFSSFYRYDESRTGTGWISYSNPLNLLIPMDGYSVNFGSAAVPLTVDATGNVNDGPLSVNLYNHNNTYTKGYSLVGNPYPSPIDWNSSSGWTKTNIDDALYFFMASTTDEYGGSYSTYIDGISNDGMATNIIPSMQGFFVHVQDGSWPVTGILGMNNSVRVTDRIHPFIKSTGKVTRPLLRFTASFSDTPDSPDFTVIYFHEYGSDEFDGKLDALKLMNSDFKVPSLFTVTPGGVNLSISAIPAVTDTVKKIPLGLKINRDGNIIFKIRDMDESLSRLKIYFTDIVAGKELEVLPDMEYNIFLPAGEYKNRFFLKMSDVATSVTEQNVNISPLSIYYSHGMLKAEIRNLTGREGKLIVSNISGQVFSVNNIYAAGHYEFNSYLADGVYLITLLSDNTRISKKIVIIN